MARKRATITDLLNDLTFKKIYEKYKLVAVNRFEWEWNREAVSPDLTEQIIENYLFTFGKSIFFRDGDMLCMCLEAQDGHDMNVYGKPLHYNAVGFGYNKTYKAEECVIIENNKLRLPTSDFLLFYTNKIAEAERTADVNIKACKTPIVFACDDKDVLTFKRIFQQVDGNVPAIFADKGLNLDAMQVFDTKAKFMGIELRDYIKGVENDLLTFLGVNNPAVDKKERLLTDEVNSNNELIDDFFNLQLEARERACEEINRLFPEVQIRVKPREYVRENVDNVDKDGDNNDSV